MTIIRRASVALLATLAFALAGCAKATLDDQGIKEYSAAVGAYQAGDFSRAIDLAAGVERRYPGFAKGFVLQGKALWFSGKGEEALAALIKAKAKDSQDQEALLWEARILRSLGRPEDAKAALDPLLSRDPEDFRLLYLKAMLLMDEDNTQAGIAFLDRALESGSELALVFLERGRVAYLLGQAEAAISYLETARALSGSSPATRDAIDRLMSSLKTGAER